jgi:hypothetical protein
MAGNGCQGLALVAYMFDLLQLDDYEERPGINQLSILEKEKGRNGSSSGELTVGFS